MDVPCVLHHHVADAEPHVGSQTHPDVGATPDDDTDIDAHITVDDNVDAWYLFDVPSIWGTLWLYAYSDLNTTCITVLWRWLIIVTTGYGSGRYTMTSEDYATIDHRRI